MSEDFDRLKAQKDALLGKGTLVWTTMKQS